MKLQIQNLTHSFGAEPVLRDLCLATGEARVLAVVGPSGGGKSTLLRVLAGLLRPEAGRVSWDGRELSFEGKSLRAYRRSVGTVFQAFNLFPHLSARENIALPLRVVHGCPPAEAEERSLRYLGRFGLGTHADKKPGALSGGQCQRVAIARSMAFEPARLFFDEPTSALDPEMTYEVLEAIREVRDEGRELILVTHEIGFAREIADEMLFLHEGRVSEQGTPRAVIDGSGTPEARRFFERVLRW